MGKVSTLLAMISICRISNSSDVKASLEGKSLREYMLVHLNWGMMFRLTSEPAVQKEKSDSGIIKRHLNTILTLCCVQYLYLQS
ncbi:hypothetical protein [Niallia sp. NCCP-28]|uniref:hypothetical protein n=1 Tax=Niallia sp. NCCP-28 TaxID=2934712 RepID=UPI0020888E37|nr:hypothetical protein [Niallia sp. NCCP-28]GKU84912.1 hypothetical protein NCCP28_43080 [Niallia sp. NCCP-28]